MPRYRIVEKRALYSGILIDAEDKEAAERGDGDVIDESETETWADDLVSAEEVDGAVSEVGDLP